MAVEINKSTDNELPLGVEVPNWKSATYPTGDALQGKYCRLERLSLIKHGENLFSAFSLDQGGRLWTYLPYGPFESTQQYCAWLSDKCPGKDPLFFAVIDNATNKAVGVASYLRIDPSNGSIEVGHLCFSPLLSRKVAATEAMYLMMKHAFDLGYRRYEWKCNSLNTASRASAQRLGLSFEGIFRQAAVIKGHNRDTAWYAAIDAEWPKLKEAFELWLTPTNFDTNGLQKSKLSTLTKSILVARG